MGKTVGAELLVWVAVKVVVEVGVEVYEGVKVNVLVWVEV